MSRPGTRAQRRPPRARFETAFVEHAYIEPEAGYAVPIGDGPDRIEVTACTQAPYMDLEETARVLGVDARRACASAPRPAAAASAASSTCRCSRCWRWRRG